MSKKCCSDCFLDEYLISFIRREGIPSYCDYCKARKKYCVDPDVLKPFFDPLIGLYESVEDFMSSEELGEYMGDMLYERLSGEWEIFSESNTSIQQLLFDIYASESEPGLEPHILHAYVVRSNNVWDEEDRNRQRLIKLWNEFKKVLMHKKRFSHGKFVIEKYFPYIVKKIQKDRQFCRARITHSKKHIPITKMGKPPAKSCQAGRCNPEGISYLYLASNAETAASEVKPYVGEYLTIAKFETQRELKVIGLRNPIIDSPFKYGQELKYALDIFEILQHVSRDLSKPLVPGKSNLEYLPTQYVCEMAKEHKYDGIFYKSSLASGYNLLLFSDKNLKCFESNLFEVKSIKTQIEQTTSDKTKDYWSLT